MKSVDVAELGAGLAALLEHLQPGEDVSILRDGEEFARVTPLVPRKQREAAQAAFDSIRQQAASLKLGPFDWEEYKKDRNFGRR